MATLILKATEKCNSNCYYCDVVRKEKTGQSMSLEMLERVFIRINEFLMGRPEENLTVIWHGGEPLLLGPDYYRTAVKFQEMHCAESKSRIGHSLQTNLTCFEEEYIDVLQALGIDHLGTSFDPEPHMRGPGRPCNSDEYNRRFMKGLHILERRGFPWGLIYVVTRKSLERPLDVFYFLSNLSTGKGFSMNPVLIYDEERKDVAISPEEYVEFLAAIFPEWWEHRGRHGAVQPFQMLADNIIDGKVTLFCGDSGECARGFINITPDGNASQCGRSEDWGLLQYGNIKEKSFEEIFQDEQRTCLEERTRYLKEHDCKGCRFWPLCHGGCPLDGYWNTKDFMNKTDWCEARRGFIARHFEPVTGVRFDPEAFEKRISHVR